MAEVIAKADIVKPENLVYKKSKVLTDNVFSYCPGCGHGTAHRLVAEVIEEMNIQADTIGVAPVGCSVLAYNFLDIDIQQAAHGRAPAVATAIKRLHPEKFVFTYQGDGDLAVHLFMLPQELERVEHIGDFFVEGIHVFGWIVGRE